MSFKIGTHTLRGEDGREYIYRDKRIGTGASSVVYKGVRCKTKEPVAIKKIDLRRFKNEKSRIQDEIKIMKKLDHIGIVKLYDVIYDHVNDYVFIVMEYCDGGDLATAIKKGQFDEHQVQMIFQQLSEAFRYLYKQKILHRDVKPQNILFKTNKHKIIKLTDFGFSKYYNNSDTLLETLCGSPMYMAPEILFHQKYNVKTDLWSIGVILYEMVYHKFPYKAGSTIELIKNVKRESVKFPITTYVPMECIDLLKKLLKKDPILRITWHEFFEHRWIHGADLDDEEFAIVNTCSKTVYPFIPRSEPVPIAVAQSPPKGVSRTGFSHYLIDDYCLGETPDSDESITLDATSPIETGAPGQKSNILEYMNISMELIRSLTSMSFKSI